MSGPTTNDQDAASCARDQRDRIEIFVGTYGHVIIKQTTANDGVQRICLHPEDVQAVLEHIALARDAATATRERLS